jgi:protoporphyrinogen oxidase
MPFPEQVPIAILGAGLTGLSCAIELSKRAPFVVFEKTERVGGHASTEHDRGYRFDRTGHLLHLRSKTWRERVLDWLDGDCVELDRRSLVFSSGVYTRYPFQANTYGLPKDIAYECLMGFLRTLTDDKSRTPENFADYCEMHFGPGFSKHFMLPYNEKLWGVPAREISATWCERFVPLPKLEDVIQGALGLPDPKLGYNARFLYPRTGIGALAEAMARRLPSIEFGRAPTRIRAKRRELVFGSERLGYEALVSTQPLPALLATIDELPAEVERARSKLRSTHLYYLDIALNCPAERDFHWAYVPEPKYPFYRVGCYTEFSPALAPAGTASLYVELAAREASSSEQALASVLPGLLEMGVVRSAADIAFARLRRLDYAYVIYDREYEAALGVIRPFLESLHIVSTGRYGGWNYSSMEDALRFGADAAQQALHWLC